MGIWVVVKIMVPFWVPHVLIWCSVVLGTQKRTTILTTTHILEHSDRHSPYMVPRCSAPPPPPPYMVMVSPPPPCGPVVVVVLLLLLLLVTLMVGA